MKRCYTIKTTFFLAGVLLTSQAYAQCPTGTNPLQLLVGTWTFSTQGFGLTSTSFGTPGPLNSAGQFVASISPAGAGVLTITDSANRNGQVTRLERDAGSFQVFPDCSGATLTFNLSTGPASFDVFLLSSGLSNCCPGPCVDEGTGINTLPMGVTTVNVRRTCPNDPCDLAHNCIICSCPGIATAPGTTTAPLRCPANSTPQCLNNYNSLGQCVLGCASPTLTTVAQAACVVTGR
jgi:hypothetical protein